MDVMAEITQVVRARTENGAEAHELVEELHKLLARLHEECPYRRMGCALREFIREVGAAD